MADTWKLVGKLHRRNSFGGYPIESLHRDIRKLAPKSIDNVSNVAVTPATNMYLRKRIAEYLRRERPELGLRIRNLVLEMEMLQYSPTDYPEGEDFHVYVRIQKRGVEKR